MFKAGVGQPVRRTDNQSVNVATCALPDMADGPYVGRRLGRQARFTTFYSETSHCRKMTAAAMLDSTMG